MNPTLAAPVPPRDGRDGAPVVGTCTPPGYAGGVRSRGPRTKGTVVASTTYDVVGMSCGHCVAAVTREVAAVPAVAHDAVDLERGTAIVDGEASDEAVIAAIAEAGYEASRRA